MNWLGKLKCFLFDHPDYLDVHEFWHKNGPGFIKISCPRCRTLIGEMEANKEFQYYE